MPFQAPEDPLFSRAPSLMRVYAMLNNKSKVTGRVVTSLGEGTTIQVCKRVVQE